jgi:hypothetical protein
MRSKIRSYCLWALFLFVLCSCRKEIPSVKYNFDSLNDRIWIGEDFWTVPIEDKDHPVMTQGGSESEVVFN